MPSFKVFGYIQPLYFFAAFALGLLFCYILTPPPEVVIKFPTPYNADEIVYKDGTDTCYKYAAEQISCPRDPSIIRDQPIAPTTAP